jgi:hemerythrin-like domain-containing protein
LRSHRRHCRTRVAAASDDRERELQAERSAFGQLVEAGSGVAVVHHPKEDDHLFKRLRERTNALDAELDELERQHERDRQLVDDLVQKVATLASAASSADAIGVTRALEDAVRGYATFLWEHMGREEGVILPAAQRHLTAADWASIDNAFAQNRDPRFGGETDKEYRQLFSRIVNAAQAWR